MKSNDVTVVISNKRKECYSLVLAFTLNVVLYIRCCILKVGGGGGERTASSGFGGK